MTKNLEPFVAENIAVNKSTIGLEFIVIKGESAKYEAAENSAEIVKYLKIYENI